MARRVGFGIAIFLILWFSWQFVRVRREFNDLRKLPTTTELVGYYPAKKAINEATAIAKFWSSDAALQCIIASNFGTHNQDDIGLNVDGIPTNGNGWTYRFLSRQKLYFLDIEIRPDGRCDSTSFSGLDYVGTEPLPGNFIDSDEAIRICEELYGQHYGKSGTIFRIVARLSTWKVPRNIPNDPVSNRATWQIEYLTTRGTDRVDLLIVLDAMTGNELVSVENVNTTSRVLSQHF